MRMADPRVGQPHVVLVGTAERGGKPPTDSTMRKSGDRESGSSRGSMSAETAVAARSVSADDQERLEVMGLGRFGHGLFPLSLAINYTGRWILLPAGDSITRWNFRSRGQDCRYLLLRSIAAQVYFFPAAIADSGLHSAHPTDARLRGKEIFPYP